MVQPTKTVSVSEEAQGISGMETHEDGIPDRIVSRNIILWFGLCLNNPICKVIHFHCLPCGQDYRLA